MPLILTDSFSSIKPKFRKESVAVSRLKWRSEPNIMSSKLGKPWLQMLTKYGSGSFFRKVLMKQYVSVSSH